MSTPTSASRTSTWVGILLGVVLLGLVAAFAIALPKAHGEESDGGGAIELELPDTLPGGYIASDDPAAFEGGELADQADAIVEQEQANADHGNQVLPEVLGRSAVTRTYVADGSQAVFVQVFQSEGGAFAPNNVPDPENTGGQAATEMTNVGDGACILTYGQGSTGAAPEPVFSQCQVTSGELTAQVGSGAISAEELVDVADQLLAELQDS
ncbi:hypothetical protein [Nocardioides sp. YIM 152315]|uniref:hypothetical protein n=1 Tax=Nocardioides sp. YIM 152315 TaxID=3031760 RepID=UPI0023DC54CD|nr:hypothetical protein [Nocardioides sp. YIM 152315]MDF1606118.1 hypothetical protein [Nocardioides sp. YIM 152315]